MARITKAQKAGLDFLDQSFFNELLVHRGMNAKEQNQLGEIITRVSHMAESKYSGREAEIIKHLAYSFLELNVASSLEEMKMAFPEVKSSVGVPLDTIKKVEEFEVSYQMGLMLAITEKSTGFKANHALEIFETLKGEFVNYSPLVRRDLVWRSFAYEFEDASVNIYCWLTVAGVLPVKKNGPDRIDSNFSAEFMIRLTLMAEYEMIKHNLKQAFSKNNLASVFLGKPDFDLNETTIDRLLDINKVFHESSSKLSLSSIPIINNLDLTNKMLVQNFFDQWGSRKVRLRMHTGTLASWLGFLGAGMIEIQRAREYTDAAEKKFNEGVESVKISDLKVPAIFNACDNGNTTTEFIKKRLSGYGLQINSDTLYRNHSLMSKTELRLLLMYCNMTRDQGIVLPVIYDDTFYMSLFIHSDKILIKKSSVINQSG
ncbi:hypothetical protein [Rheinheimera hassiensis]|uniref:hypothetical protein n=1 Tax=Rheinheimera hassiensis TaxID=1193627 RepID=UPI001F06BED1|nr:hypothetical protein [Rheinheimera hassiensis]